MLKKIVQDTLGIIILKIVCQACASHMAEENWQQEAEMY